MGLTPLNTRLAARPALQGHEILPKTKGGGVAGNDAPPFET